MFKSVFVAVIGFAIVSSFGCAMNQPTSGGVQPSRPGDFRFQDEGPRQSDPGAFSTLDRNLPGTRIEVDHNSSATDRNRQEIVKQVLVTGNKRLPEHQILRQIRTRPGRYFDPDLLQQDVNQLWKIKQIRRVNGPFIDRQEDGIVITIDVNERKYMDKVQYIGNRAITDRQLAEETGLSSGQPLDSHSVKMAKSRIEDFYEEKGFPKTEVSIVEGNDIDDSNVVFLIHEDELQRINSVQFEGNTIAPDGRLKSMLKMKPGILLVFGGKVNRRELEQDRLRLESYYRSLGFFNARIGRELVENESGKWLTIRYIINEGPRYRIRSVSFIGNEKFSTDQLASVVKLQPMSGESPEFNASEMNQDTTRLEDLYGSKGYVFAKIDAEPRFLETPGVLDLVYKITEGEQYRVGQINVVIDGEYGVTRRQAVINRLGGLRPGDPIDSRLLRDAEGRLRRSRLFSDGTPGSGAAPRVVVKPTEKDQAVNRYR